MCIKEGLRLHCPVPLVGRELTTDLDIGDRVIPRNTVISVNIITDHYRFIHYRSTHIYSHVRIQRGGGPAPEKSQNYRISLQYWSGSLEKPQSYEGSIQCWAIIGTPTKLPLIVVFGSFLPSSTKK